MPRKRLKIVREMAYPPKIEPDTVEDRGAEADDAVIERKVFGVVRRCRRRVNRKLRSKVTTGREILPGIDGRSLIARRYRDVLEAICQDQGGKDRLAEARIQLIRRFSAAAVMAEEMEAQLALGKTINVAEHAQLTSAMVRVASRIGINRRAREIVPTLNEYLTTQVGVDEQAEPDPVEIDHDDDDHQSDD